MSGSASERRAKTLEQIAKKSRRARSRQTPKIAPSNRKQEQAFSDLKYAAKHMQRWGGLSPTEVEKNSDQFAQDRADYVSAVGHAIRAGLFNHPNVRAWLSTQRSLGEWDVLRRFRLGLEYGTKRTMSAHDFWIKLEATPLFEEGKKPEQIRRILRQKLRFPTPGDRNRWKEWLGLDRTDLKSLAERLNCSRQNFNRLLKRLEIR